MRTQTIERVRKVAADIFGCDIKEIGENTTAQDINGWDSLSHTIFIMSIEKEFGLKLPTRKIFQLRNVGDLVRMLEQSK